MSSDTFQFPPSSIVFRKKNHSILNLYRLPQNSHRLCALSVSSKNDKKSTSLSVFDIESSKELSTFGSSGTQSPITSAAISGEIIIAGTEDGHIFAYSEKTGSKQPIFEIKPESISKCSSISVNFNGILLAAGVDFKSAADQSDQSDSDDEASDHGILFYDLRSAPSALLGAYKDSHSDCISCLAFHATDPDLLVTGGDDGLVNIFDLKQPNEDDALQFTFNCLSSVSKLGFWKSTKPSLFGLTDDEKLFGWTTDDGDELFSIEDPKKIFPKEDDEQIFIIGCFQPNSIDRLFVLGSTAEGNLSGSQIGSDKKGMVVFDDLTVGHTDMVRCLLWDDQANVVLTGGDDGVVIRSDMAGHLRENDEPDRKRRKK